MGTIFSLIKEKKKKRRKILTQTKNKDNVISSRLTQKIESNTAITENDTEDIPTSLSAITSNTGNHNITSSTSLHTTASLLSSDSSDSEFSDNSICNNQHSIFKQNQQKIKSHANNTHTGILLSSDSETDTERHTNHNNSSKRIYNRQICFDISDDDEDEEQQHNHDTINKHKYAITPSISSSSSSDDSSTFWSPPSKRKQQSPLQQHEPPVTSTQQQQALPTPSSLMTSTIGTCSSQYSSSGVYNFNEDDESISSGESSIESGEVHDWLQEEEEEEISRSSVESIHNDVNTKLHEELTPARNNTSKFTGLKERAPPAPFMKSPSRTSNNEKPTTTYFQRPNPIHIMSSSSPSYQYKSSPSHLNQLNKDPSKQSTYHNKYTSPTISVMNRSPLRPPPPLPKMPSPYFTKVNHSTPTKTAAAFITSPADSRAPTPVNLKTQYHQQLPKKMFSPPEQPKYDSTTSMRKPTYKMKNLYNHDNNSSQTEKIDPNLLLTNDTNVKDTIKIKRKKASLPTSKPIILNGGNWLTNRYIVNNYILLQSLGSGSYAEVRLAKEKKSNQLFAMKIMNKLSLKGGKMEDVKREIAIMKKLRHENLLRLYEVMDDPKVNKLYLVLEYMERLDLWQITSEGKVKLNCEQVWDIAKQVLGGIAYLHQNQIIHGDIKPQNLLVSNEGIVKIADFGISRMLQEDGDEEISTNHGNKNRRMMVGTPAFMAPEQWDNSSTRGTIAYNGELADMYSVGATLYCLRCGHPPFLEGESDLDNEEKDDDENKKKKKNNKSHQIKTLHIRVQSEPITFSVKLNVCIGLIHFIEGLMVKNPLDRMTLKDALSDSWILGERPKEDVVVYSSDSESDTECTDRRRRFKDVKMSENRSISFQGKRKPKISTTTISSSSSSSSCSKFSSTSSSESSISYPIVNVTMEDVLNSIHQVHETNVLYTSDSDSDD